jgi:uncharacterized iron-regulated membrane protein
MRKWHRWLSILVGVFILFIAVTGVLSQVGSLVNAGGFETEASKRAQEAATDAQIPAGFTCPDNMTCRVRLERKPGEWNVGYLHHLHSGEEFGPVGVTISLLSGLALIFFAISGLYMYIELYRGRLTRTRSGKSNPGGRFFW